MDYINYAKETFLAQIKELENLMHRIDENIEVVCDRIISCKGKVVITGIGKSGIIGKKISATLSSTGTLSVFLNAAEALHGDLGIVSRNDIVIAISNSGNSEEVLSIIPSLRTIGVTLVAMTGNMKSKLAKSSDIVIDIGVKREVCPMNLAPTTSTTATLVMGDAIASILIKKRSFKPENFALYHPGGSLGRRLLTTVSDIMQKETPICSEDTKIEKIINIMTETRLGAVCVCDKKGMIGIITEGDIRRALKKKQVFFELSARDIMTTNYSYIEENKQAVDALSMMEQRDNQISVLPVIKKDRLIGLLRIHDLLQFK